MDKLKLAAVIGVSCMKLVRAVIWYFRDFEPSREYRDALRNVESMAGFVFLFLVALVFFFVQGIMQGNEKQVWGCGFGLMAISIPIIILVMTLLGSYDQYREKED